LKENQIESVQALRGLAALAVMFFHYRWILNLDTPGLGDQLFGLGAVGVDLFFIISGFVITLSIKRTQPKQISTVIFIKKRAIRLLPAYYVLLLITFLFSGAMSTFHYPEKVRNLLSALTFTPYDAAHAPFYVDASGMYGIRWTLNYEIYFYLITAVSLFFRKNWLVLYGFFACSLVALPLFAGFTPTLNVSGYNFGSAHVNLMTNPIIWQFLAGVTIGLLYPYLKNTPAKWSFPLLFLAIAAAVWGMYFNGYNNHGIDSAGAFLTLLFLAVVICDRYLARYTPRFLVYLGKISYSLYLLHTMLNTALDGRIDKLGISYGWPRFILYSVFAILLAHFSYKYIEQWFSRKLSSGKTTTSHAKPA